MTEISLNIVRLTESYALCLGTEGKSPKIIEWYACNLKRFAKFLSDNQLPESVSELAYGSGSSGPYCRSAPGLKL